ncbi:hypothetical protein O181_008541 [Austropuccinia psidii MF-1]|uniref:Uncharacterized protein n=1 Tax=Austropuccinia psidii MF-1 TaxID=1389203 RepID=A0A9Q3BMQ6_9BASI|nr:hypothetical protein [Austropuccinia psidii MF-1]
MSTVNLRNLPEHKPGLLRTKRSGHGNHSLWQDTEGNNTNFSIHLPIQQEPQTRGLEGYGSSSQAPQEHQRFILMEHGKQDIQTSFTLGITLSSFTEDLFQRDTL